jgi:hypothetical protein
MGVMFEMMPKMNLDQSGSARTSDWIGKLEGGVLYAYDLSGTINECKRSAESLPKKKEHGQ